MNVLIVNGFGNSEQGKVLFSNFVENIKSVTIQSFKRFLKLCVTNQVWIKLCTLLEIILQLMSSFLIIKLNPLI
jgi:hypothetical protein